MKKVKQDSASQVAEKVLLSLKNESRKKLEYRLVAMAGITAACLAVYLIFSIGKVYGSKEEDKRRFGSYQEGYEDGISIGRTQCIVERLKDSK